MVQKLGKTEFRHRDVPDACEDYMNTPKGYSLSQIRLHWVVAALIVSQYLFKDAIGQAWDAYIKGSETSFDPLVLAHVLAGVLILAFTLWRLRIRATRGAPQPPEQEAPMLKLAAHLTHWTLYALMILMPLSGVLAWFGDVELGAIAHNILKLPLLALAVLHVLAALFHQFVLKTNLIARMKTAEE